MQLGGLLEDLTVARAGRALSGASGPMICATLSPAGLWIMMRTLNAWPRLWATPMKR